MATKLICARCDGAIEEAGWRAEPAIVEDARLVGYYEGPHGAGKQRVGEPIDLCLSCVAPVPHPSMVTTAEEQDAE